MSNDLERPPGPAPSVFDPANHDKDPVAWYRKMVAEYGNFVHYVESGDNVYFVNEPDLIHQIFFEYSNNLEKGTSAEMRRVLGQALVVTSGPIHDEHRHVMESTFSHPHVAALAGTIVELALRSRDHLRDGERIDIFREMNALTVSIIAKTMFDVDVTAMADEIREAINEAYNANLPVGLPFSHLLLKMPLPENLKFREGMIRVRNILQKIIRDREEDNRDHGDLLSALLKARADGTMHATDEMLFDEVQGIFLGGHETTANGLSFACYLLSQNPEVEKKLQAEVDTVLQGRAPEAADVAHLKYTRQVFSEALRLYPPAYSIGRRVLEDFWLGKYFIPAGSIVRISPMVTQSDPRFWPHPEKFDPDRFLAENVRQRPKFAYYPFAAGPNVCLGESLAWMESIIALAVFAQKWHLQYDGPIPLETEARITLRPKGGLHVIPRLRA